MSAVPIRTFAATLSRSTSPISWEAFAGTPLAIVGALPTGQDFTGITAIRAELHDELSNSAAPLAVSDTLSALPTGASVTLTFSSAATNRAAGRYWISVYATYASGRLEVFRLAELHLVEGAVSQLTPQAPAPALYATTVSVDSVAARVTALEVTPPGSSPVTSVAGRTGAITLSQSDIGGTALPSAVTSAPGLLTTAGGTLGTAAYTASSDYVPTGRTVNGQPLSANVTVTSITGNASTATALATARTIALTGPVTGSGSFDGTANATLATTLTATGVTPGTYTAATLTVGADGRITAASTGTASVDLSSPGPIGATTASTVRATNFTSTTGVNSFGNTNFQDLSVFNLLGSSKANLQSALTLGAFDDATHKGITLTGVLTITSSGSTPVFTYASGAAAIHRTALGLGTLATVSPTGTADATTYLRGDGTWATNLAVTTESTTARTLSLADNNTYIRCTNTSPTTITIPLQATVTWPPAAMITFRRAAGAGAVTLVGEGVVTIAGNTASSIAAEGVFAIVRTGTNTWDFV